jgi:leucyl-tRNA synthetase
VRCRRVAVRAVMRTLREMFTQALATLAPHTASAVTKTGGQSGESPAQHPTSMACAAVNGVPS